MTLRMKAAGYGEPDTLQSHDVDLPEPGQGEVRIAVRAVGVNPTDCAVPDRAPSAVMT